MTIPPTLKIGGLTWTISFNKDIAREGNCFGSTHIFSQKINIDPDTPLEHQEEIFIHEIIHALIWTTGLHTVIDVDKKLEEQIVSHLSPLLYQVLKDNDMIK